MNISSDVLPLDVMVQDTGQECTHHIEGRFVTCVFNQILYEEHPNYQTRYKADLLILT